MGYWNQVASVYVGLKVIYIFFFFKYIFSKVHPHLFRLFRKGHNQSELGGGGGAPAPALNGVNWGNHNWGLYFGFVLFLALHEL